MWVKSSAQFHTSFFLRNPIPRRTSFPEVFEFFEVKELADDGFGGAWGEAHTKGGES